MVHCSTISVLLFHDLCATVPTSNNPLFHQDCSTVPPSNVPLFNRQMFYCSTIKCSTIPPLDVPPFHHFCPTVPPWNVQLFHHHISHGSTINCSTIPPFTTKCSTNYPPSDVPPLEVLLFHHQRLYCSTIRCSTVTVKPLFDHQITCSLFLSVVFNRICFPFPAVYDWVFPLPLIKITARIDTANAKKLTKAEDRNPPITAHTLTSVWPSCFLRGQA